MVRVTANGRADARAIAFDPPEAGLRDRVMRGAVTTYAAQIIRFVIQLASVVIMSRLLTPIDFGLLAMVTPIYGLILLFQDFGFTQAAIQRRQITHAQINDLFWINLAISAGFACLLLLLAPMIGWFYGDHRVVNLTRAFAALLVFVALPAQHLALINRMMRFQYLAIIDTLAYLLGFLGSVMLAHMLRSYWALFATPAIMAFVTAIGAWIGSGFVPGRPRRRHDVGELLRMGRGFTGFNICAYVSRNLDNVLIGQAWGNFALGLYDRAYKLLLFPLQQVQTPLARVMLPTLSRLQDDHERYRAVYLRAVGQLLLVMEPATIFTIATADVLIPTLLGEQWKGAARIFLWLGLAALQQPISGTTNWLFITQGRSQSYFRWGLFNVATSTAAFLAGLPWGPVGVAAAYSITQICPRMPVLWWMATRSGPVTLSDLCKAVMPHAAAGAASFAAVLLVLRLVQIDRFALLCISLCVSYAAAILVLAALPAGRATLRETCSLALAMIGRGGRETRASSA
jgi:PST family polysaccharide transporter